MGAVDALDPAVRTYGLNFAHPLVKADIRELSAERFWKLVDVEPTPLDLVVGGPPCQGFSIQRIGDDQDDRNYLLFEFARLVREFRPRMYLMENVPGLLGRRGRALSMEFVDCMRAAGYDTAYEVLNAAEYGVPQIRKRVFFCGWRDDLPPFSFPSPIRLPEEYVTVWGAIGDLPSPPEDGTAPPEDRLHRRTRLSALNLKRIRLIPPGRGFESLPPELRVECHKNGAAQIGHRYVYGRLAPDRPAGTITARFDSFTRGKFGHPFEDRNITLREGARLQTFPDDFRFVGTQEEIAALIGNAVPPLMGEIIGAAVLQHLTGSAADPGSLPRGRLSSARQLSLLASRGEDDARHARHVERVAPPDLPAPPGAVAQPAPVP